MDVAPWCYKSVGGGDGYIRVGWGKEHLTVQKRTTKKPTSPAPYLLQSETGFVIMKTRLLSGVILQQSHFPFFTGGQGYKDTNIIHHSEELDFFGWTLNRLIKGLLMKLVTISRWWWWCFLDCKQRLPLLLNLLAHLGEHFQSKHNNI